jgi:hypothetical protein
VTARARIWVAAPWAAAAVLGVLIARFSVRIHTLQPDEASAVDASRYYVLQHPLSAIDPTVNLSGRGLERAVAVQFALVQAIVGDTAHAYWVQHVLGGLIFATVIVVVAAWGRDLGLRGWQALVTGVAAGCVPWMVLGTSLLNSGPAYVVTVLALWAIWRAIVAPSLARDIVAVLALLALALTRVGNVIVAVAWPLSIVAFALHDRAPGVGLGAAVAGLPRRVWREHPLLVVLGAAGVLALLIGGTHWLVGGYPVRAPLGGAFRTLVRVMLAYLAMGTAVVPAVVALAYVARSLVRPDRPGDAAFAALGAGAFLALAYAAATQGAEERYIAPLAAILILMAMAALARGAVGPLLVLVAGVVVARVVTVTGAGSDIGPYGYFAQAAQTFFRRVVLGKASLIGPVPDAHVLTTVLVLAVGAAVLAAVAARRWPDVALGATAGAVALFGLVAGLYSMNQFMNQAGLPTVTFEEQAWVDGAVGSGADVELAPQGLDTVQRELILFNRSLGTLFRPRRATLTVDPATGELHGAPHYLVVQDGVLQTIGVGGPQVAASAYLPVQARLIRVEPRALWQLTSPRSVRLFGGSGCLTATLAQPAGTATRQPFTFGAAHGVLAGAPVTVVTPVAPEVRLQGGGSAAIVGLSRGPCG